MLLQYKCLKSEIVRAENKKPIRKPPDAPKSVEIPPLNPEKTGTPIAPKAIYKATEDTEILGEKQPDMRNIAKSCKEKLTIKGIDIHAQSVINAQHIAVSAIS